MFSQVGQTRLFLLLAFAGELCQAVALIGKSVSLKGGVGSHMTACLVIWPDASIKPFIIFPSQMVFVSLLTETVGQTLQFQ